MIIRELFWGLNNAACEPPLEVLTREMTGDIWKWRMEGTHLSVTQKLFNMDYPNISSQKSSLETQLPALDGLSCWLCALIATRLHYSNPWFHCCCCCLKQSHLAMWSRVSWTVSLPAFTSQVLGRQAFATMLLCSSGVGSRALCMLHAQQLL